VRYFTYTYVKSLKISEFIHASVCPKNMYHEMWSCLNDRSGNALAAETFLKSCLDYQLPTIVKSRYEFGFRTGLYFLETDKFLRYNKAEDRKLIEAAYYSNACVKKVPAKYHDMDFDMAAMDKIMLEAPLLPTGHDDWYALPTPAFQAIWEYQGLDERTIRIIYAFFGKLLYELKKCEHWEVQFIMVGVAGAGKSTVMDFIKAFFDNGDVAFCNNNGEKNFPLEGLAECLAYFFQDVSKNCNFDQPLWNQMISGEEIGIARKGKPIFFKEFLASGMMACNALPQWPDLGFSFARRGVIVELNKIVRNCNTHLLKDLKLCTPIALRKFNLAYRYLVRDVGNRSIWKYLEKHAPYFLEKREELKKVRNPLAAFITDKNRFLTSGPDLPQDVNLYVKFETFESLYHSYCDEKRLPFKRQLTPECYSTIFAHMNIEVTDETISKPLNCNDKNGVSIRGRWILGIAPVDLFTPQELEKLQIQGLANSLSSASINNH